jgi:hypothetical protein
VRRRPGPLAIDRPPSSGDLAVLASAAMFAVPAGTLLSASAGFALGHPVSALDLAAGGVLAAAVALLGARWGGEGAARRAVLALTAVAVVSSAALWIAPLRFDITWDGQAYHQQAVVALARGWNPLGPPLTEADLFSYGNVNYQSKGAWVVEAAVYRFTGRLETAKALQLLALAGAFLAVLGALREVVGLARAAALGVAAVVALNPVALSQVFTFYVDGVVASSLAAFAALALLAVLRRDRLALLGLTLVTLLLVNAKLTGLAYAALLWTAAAVAAALVAGAKRALAVGAAGAIVLLVAVLGPGWNPYLTNTIREGHPFYPAAGPRAQDIARNSRPESFGRMNRLERLARSTFAVTSNEIERGARLKVPFVVLDEEGGACGSCDIRLAGLGPLFSGALVLGAAAMWLAQRRAALAGGLLATALLGTALVTAEGWWARFAPQLWLVPVALAVPALAAPGRRGARVMGTLVLLVLAADAALVGVNSLNRSRRVERALRLQLAELARTRAPVEVRLHEFEAAGVRLSEAGVRWRAVPELHCTAPVPLAGSFRVRLCPAPAGAQRGW